MSFNTIQVSSSPQLISSRLAILMTITLVLSLLIPGFAASGLATTDPPPASSSPTSPTYNPNPSKSILATTPPQSITVQMFNDYSIYSFLFSIPSTTTIGSTFELQFSLDGGDVGILRERTDGLRDAEDLKIDTLFTANHFVFPLTLHQTTNAELESPLTVAFDDGLLGNGEEVSRGEDGEGENSSTTTTADPNESATTTTTTTTSTLETDSNGSLLTSTLSYLNVTRNNNQARLALKLIRDDSKLTATDDASSSSPHLTFQLDLKMNPIPHKPFPLYLKLYQSEHFVDPTIETIAILPRPDLGPNSPLQVYYLDINTGFSQVRKQLSWLGPQRAPGGSVLPLSASLLKTGQDYFVEKKEELNTTLDLNAKLPSEKNKMEIATSLYTSITFKNDLMVLDNAVYYTIQIGEAVLPVGMGVDQVQCGIIVSPTPDDVLDQYSGPDYAIQDDGKEEEEEESSSSSDGDSNPDVTESNQQEDILRLELNSNLPADALKEDKDNHNDRLENSGPIIVAASFSSTSSSQTIPKRTKLTFSKLIIHHGHIHLVTPHLSYPIGTEINIQCMLPAVFRSRSPYPYIKTLHQLTPLRQGPITAITTTTPLPDSFVIGGNGQWDTVILGTSTNNTNKEHNDEATTIGKTTITQDPIYNPNPALIPVSQYQLTAMIPFSSLLQSQPKLPSGFLQPDGVRSSGMKLKDIQQLQLKFDKQEYITKLFHNNWFQDYRLDGYTIAHTVKEFLRYANVLASNGGRSGDDSDLLTADHVYLSTFPEHFTYSQTLPTTSDLASPGLTRAGLTEDKVEGAEGAAGSAEGGEVIPEDSGFATFTFPISFSLVKSSLINSITALLPIINQQSGQTTQFRLEPMWLYPARTIKSATTTSSYSNTDANPTTSLLSEESDGALTNISEIQHVDDVFRNNNHFFYQECSAAHLLLAMADDTLMLKPLYGTQTPGSSSEEVLDLNRPKETVLTYHKQFCTKLPTSSPCQSHQDCMIGYYCDDWSNTCQYGNYRIEITLPYLTPPHEGSWLSRFVGIFFENYRGESTDQLNGGPSINSAASVIPFNGLLTIIGRLFGSGRRGGMGVPIAVDTVIDSISPKSGMTPLLPSNSPLQALFSLFSGVFSALTSQPVVVLPTVTLLIVSGHVCESILDLVVFLLHGIIMNSFNIFTNFVSIIATLLYDFVIELSFNYRFYLIKYQNFILDYFAIVVTNVVQHAINLDFTWLDYVTLSKTSPQLKKDLTPPLSHLINPKILQSIFPNNNLSPSTNPAQLNLSSPSYTPTNLPIPKPSIFSIGHYYTQFEIIQLGYMALFVLGAMMHVMLKFPHFNEVLPAAVS